MLIVPLSTKGVDSHGVFYGYASVFNVVNHDGDILVPGVFQASLASWTQKEKKPAMLWQHEPNVRIGQWHELFEDAYGLAVKGKIDLSLSAGRHTYQMMQTGDVKGLSVGFVSMHALKRHGHRYICEADLCEISIVTEACNRMACITHIPPYPQVEHHVHT